MTMKAIAQELVNRGYEATTKYVTKNGARRLAIIVGASENVSAAFYKHMLTGATVEENADIVEQTLEASPAPNFDISMMTDTEYIKANCFACVQRKGTESIAKEDYLDLEAYIRVKVSDDGTYKLPASLYTPEIMLAAIRNINGKVGIKGMNQTMREMGMPIPDDVPDTMWVVSTEGKTYGASALFMPSLFHNFCADMHLAGCWVIPSSIHELLIIPDDGEQCKAELDAMVKEVNANEVAPEEQLADHCYHYSMATNEITF